MDTTLDQIDWAMLSHAYGPATDVPQMIHALRSTDHATREEAYDELFSTIWHQGTVYSASGPSAPFLIALISDPTLADRPSLLALLHALATGSSYIDAHELLDQDDIAAMNSEELAEREQERAQERADVEAAHSAVASGLATYNDLLVDPDPEVRSSTLQLLTAFPEHAPSIIPRLRSLLADEQDRAVRLGLTLALHLLADGDPQHCTIFADQLTHGDEPVTQLLAAIALIARQGEQAPTRAFERVEAALQVVETDKRWLDHPDDRTWSIARGYLPSPWHHSLIRLMMDSWDSLSLEQRPVLYIAALRTVLEPEVAHHLAERLLAHAFGQSETEQCTAGWSRTADGRPCLFYYLRTQPTQRTSGQLTPSQRHAVLALAHADVLWGMESNLLACYGMPATQAALQEWLA